MDMNQLAQELAMLKQESEMAKQEKRLGGFVDKYGMKFGNDTDIANLILAEMDRQGVDGASEAASQAVQQVLDKLRMEATTILDKIKMQEQEASTLADKISAVEESVAKATEGVAPGAEGPLAGDPMAPPPDIGAPMDAGAPPPDMGAPMDAGAPPPDIGGAPPMDAGALPPDMGGGEPGLEMPAEDPNAAPPAPPPPPPEASGDPNMIPSDVRLKNIRAKFAQHAASRKASAQVPSDKNVKKMWKPSRSMLDGIRGLV